MRKQPLLILITLPFLSPLPQQKDKYSHSLSWVSQKKIKRQRLFEES